jgi:hypothetical protein
MSSPWGSPGHPSLPTLRSVAQGVLTLFSITEEIASKQKERPLFQAAALYQNNKSFLIELSFSSFKSPLEFFDAVGRFEVMFISI